jgi:nicotinamide-nucleotide amidase
MTAADGGGPDAPVLRAGDALGGQLRALGLTVVTAESCTGGLVARALTETGGASVWFDRGFVTYANEAKTDALGVGPDTLRAHGAVSEPVAREMALGALRRSRAQLAIAVTGIAGPTGGVPGKPVGTVCFAWAWVAPGDDPATPTLASETRHLDGDRAQVRRLAALHAIESAGQRLRAALADRPPAA